VQCRWGARARYATTYSGQAGDSLTAGLEWRLGQDCLTANASRCHLICFIRSELNGLADYCASSRPSLAQARAQTLAQAAPGTSMHLAGFPQLGFRNDVRPRSPLSPPLGLLCFLHPGLDQLICRIGSDRLVVLWLYKSDTVPPGLDYLPLGERCCSHPSCYWLPCLSLCSSVCLPTCMRCNMRATCTTHSSTTKHSPKSNYTSLNPDIFNIISPESERC